MLNTRKSAKLLRTPTCGRTSCTRYGCKGSCDERCPTYCLGKGCAPNASPVCGIGRGGDPPILDQRAAYACHRIVTRLLGWDACRNATNSGVWDRAIGHENERAGAWVGIAPSKRSQPGSSIIGHSPDSVFYPGRGIFKGPYKADREVRCYPKKPLADGALSGPGSDQSHDRKDDWRPMNADKRR